MSLSCGDLKPKMLKELKSSNEKKYEKSRIVMQQTSKNQRNLNLKKRNASVGWWGVGLSKLWGFGSRKKIKSTSSEPTSLFQRKIFPTEKTFNTYSCPRAVFFARSALIESYYGLYLHINAPERRPFWNCITTTHALHFKILLVAQTVL